ncbi:hypothetical protein ACHAW6_009607 [Cyclotella cf. meneghiniana]
MTNDGMLASTKKVALSLSRFSTGTRIAHVLPRLKLQALMSIRTLTDNGFIMVFHLYSKGITVHEEVQLISGKPTVLYKGGRTPRECGQFHLSSRLTFCQVSTSMKLPCACMSYH